MDIWFDAAQQICATLPNCLPADVRIPARQAACDCYNKWDSLPSAHAFGTLYGAPLVINTVLCGNRVLFELSDAFYCACVERVNATLPMPETDFGDVALNKMLRYARHGGHGCPNDPRIQRALWLCIGCTQTPAMAASAKNAYQSMLHGQSVCARQSLLNEIGPLSAACARLYARLYPLKNPRF